MKSWIFNVFWWIRIKCLKSKGQCNISAEQTIHILPKHWMQSLEVRYNHYLFIMWLTSWRFTELCFVCPVMCEHQGSCAPYTIWTSLTAVCPTLYEHHDSCVPYTVWTSGHLCVLHCMNIRASVCSTLYEHQGICVFYTVWTSCSCGLCTVFALRQPDYKPQFISKRQFFCFTRWLLGSWKHELNKIPSSRTL